MLQGMEDRGLIIVDRKPLATESINEFTFQLLEGFAFGFREEFPDENRSAETYRGVDPEAFGHSQALVHLWEGL
jgi:hypothetical protein